MFIKSMIIDGFKSYGQRTEVNGFDEQFNAITGLNGSGKSNILDAICFVLGITNLSQVRAGSLQELVYKSGQAGITKASVTVVFDNSDPEKSPLGYERQKEITITRQAVVAGKNRYLINGSTAQNKRVNDLFNSVQLNVNNPHFLIMQGRITKVLNMKPPEILSMIEEAAGTRMYETKKQTAEKTIEKKDAKLKELNALLNEEIGPKLAKLKEEREQYLQLQKVHREQDHLSKIYIAWSYVQLEASTEKKTADYEAMCQDIELKKQQIVTGDEKIKDYEEEVDKLGKERDAESGGRLKELQDMLSKLEQQEAKQKTELKCCKESIEYEEKKKKQLEKNLKVDETSLKEGEKKLATMDDVFTQLKKTEAEDKAALEAAQHKFEAISSGIMSGEDGQESTLQDQLMNAKEEASKAQTESKQCTMQLAHNRTQLTMKQKEMKQTEADYLKDKRQLDSMQKDLHNLEKEMSKINYEDGKIERLQESKRRLVTEVRSLRESIELTESRKPMLSFVYKDPEKNFNRASVKGLVCTLFKVKDPKFSMAIETAAGGRLYNVIVDNDETSKKLIQKGQLQRRYTFVPLNKMTGRVLDAGKIRTAQQLVGADKVYPALSLIEYDRIYQPAMEWLFGQVFVCDNMNSARVVTFDKRILTKCVTLEGDVMDPAGTISGGAQMSSSSMLNLVAELVESRKSMEIKQNQLQDVENEIRSVERSAETYNNLKQRFEIKQNEVQNVEVRLQQTTHHQHKVEVEQLQASLDELQERTELCKQKEKEFLQKAKDLEGKVANAKNLRSEALKKAEVEISKLQKKCQKSSDLRKEREQEFETLRLDIAELKKSVDNWLKEINENANLEQLRDKVESLTTLFSEVKEKVQLAQTDVKEQQKLISKQNVEIQQISKKRDKTIKECEELKLKINSMNHEAETLKDECKHCKSKLHNLKKNYTWIETDRGFFGKDGNVYDFHNYDMSEVEKKLNELKELKEKLSRTVNTKAMNLLGKEEEQYAEMMRKKTIVENDKKKIFAVIKELDEKKKEALKVAWQKVNKDFGSIFGSLLPGANAKLKPPDGKDLLDGLEVKIGFNNIWKDSLGELSGGQRSLVALSLILAMLLFKPAPIYILDEVDAALDLSHTQNIGQMLKAHFKTSQFIIVSLKDGMFNNANVLFRTKFVDGMSTVTRTTPGH
uniref:Structural maintenance of chromosomes protein n=1 Tax=Clastoptera arizonana TaxID=38151 RepID=A0A1B6DSC9_9HEMI